MTDPSFVDLLTQMNTNILQLNTSVLNLHAEVDAFRTDFSSMSSMVRTEIGQLVHHVDTKASDGYCYCAQPAQ